MGNILNVIAVVIIGVGAIGFLYSPGSTRDRVALLITCLLTGGIVGYVAQQWS